MGTNFYLVKKECDCCGRHEQLHIGKRSSGWAFFFKGVTEGIPQIRSWKDWQTEIDSSENKKPVIDEYGKRFTFDEFFKIVDETKNAKFNHYDYCLDQNYPGWDKRIKEGVEWKDKEGWSFSSNEFS